MNKLTLGAMFFLVAAAGCDHEPVCGREGLRYSRDLGRCTCANGGDWLPDSGVCVLPDGAVVSLDDGGVPSGDAGACTSGETRPCEGGTDVGECASGSQSCVDGVWSECSGVVGPAAETCNGLDDDCDTVVDGPTAALACGSAERATAVGCTAGECVVTTCATGYADCDGDFANGCEQQLGTVDHCNACGDSCAFACGATGCDDAVSVDAYGRSSCAVLESGRIACWGGNGSGQLGDGTTTGRPTPVFVRGIGDAVEVALGANHGCARSRDGAVRCWGSNNEGQVATGAFTAERVIDPLQVALPGPASQIVSGARHTCALMSDRSVRCWGRNVEGQLGDGSNSSRPSAVPVAMSNVAFLAAGSLHTCAGLESGQARCWGWNETGALGDGTMTTRNVPTIVSGLFTVQALAGGVGHTCAVLAGGELRCWGSNTEGQIGDGTRVGPRTLPVSVSGFAGARSLALGNLHSCARTEGGAVVCWGDNQRGQLGEGTTVRRDVPVAVMRLSGATALAAGGSNHSCAVSSGRVLCWGESPEGLGDGTSTISSVPVAVLVR